MKRVTKNHHRNHRRNNFFFGVKTPFVLVDVPVFTIVSASSSPPIDFFFFFFFSDTGVSKVKESYFYFHRNSKHTVNQDAFSSRNQRIGIITKIYIIII